MGVFKTLGKIAALLLVCSSSFSQDYLEFVENKGQWDSQIKFKGELSTGAFLLQSQGYRVVLYDQKDLARRGKAALSLNTNTQQTDGNRKQVNSAPGSVEGGGNDASPGSADFVMHGHIYEVRFLNANKSPQVVPDKPQPGLSNYIYGNDSTQWTKGCKTYLGVTYKDMYPGIDVRYYTSNGVLKYDIIVHPGADPSRIAMYFDGVDELKVKDGALNIKTSVDMVKEAAPYTYQLAKYTRTDIASSYDVKGNIVRFRVADYEKNATLVIDPSVIFSTFTGSRADNWGYTATYDGSGNFYAGGIVFSSPATGFPVSNGAFQQRYQGGGETGEHGGFDVGIIKFDPSGANRIYATYIGGTTGNEQPHSMVVDAQGNLVIAGRTTSTNFPTKGALQTFGPGGGGWDIFICKLNATGSDLIGSVRIGGSKSDGVNIKHKYDPTTPVGAQSINRNYGDDARSDVLLDGAGNIYYASCTQSPDFATTAVSVQKTLAGANSANRSQDALILKLRPDLSGVLFSVLFGGSDDDAAFVLSLSPITGNLFVGGATASSNFPGDKTGVKYPAAQGLSDGFVTEFTANGDMVRTSYFGTPGIDLIYGIQFDKFGFPYIAGTSTGAWPVQNAAFSQPGGKQFIAKLKPDLSDFVYSTTFGTALAAPNISPTAFLVDRCENVYVSGWGGSANFDRGFPSAGTKNLPITPDAYQKSTDGNDFYFFVLAKNASSQLYGSYFGEAGGYGEHVDGGTSRFDQNGVIYQAMCANCNSGGQFPTTPGVWAPRNGTNSQGCNLAAIKIAFNLAGIGAGLRASVNGVINDTSNCVPVTAQFSDTLAMGQKYIWDFNDGSPVVTTTTPNISHTFSSVGVYRVKLTTIDSNSCNIADSAYVTMRVRDDEVLMGFNVTKLPPCSALSYEFTNTSTARKPFTATSFIWDFGDGVRQAAGGGSVTHAYAAAGTYNVKLLLVDTNYCNEPDSVVKVLRIATNVKAQFTTPAVGCVPYNAQFTNNSLGGDSFIWDFGDGTTSTQTDPQHLYTATGAYQVRLIAIDPNTCNQRDTSAYFTVTVNPNPSASYSYTPNPTEANTPVTFLNASAGATRFVWHFDDGDTLLTLRPDTTVRHLYRATGTYNVCLIAYNNSGCTDSTCQPVSVTINSLVDVANAFSPNGDGVNDRIFVKGYGIEKMQWTIYNRWGAIVYQGSSLTEGWDGRWNGKLQPQDVYHYTLVVEFGDKGKTTKKGDITLLR